MNYCVVYWETNAFVLTTASAEAIKFYPQPISKPGSRMSPARSGSYFLASILIWTSVPRRGVRVDVPLGINAGRVSLIICSNTFRDNWTLTSDSDFLLIKKAGTFLHICADIHNSHAQTTINYCCLVEPSWKNATTLNPKSSLIVSRFPVCYVG